MPSSIADNLKHVRERIALAAARVGRSPDEIELLVVSKFQPVEAVAEAIHEGQHLFGENRFQGTPAKIEAIRNQFPDLTKAIHWSFIGGLQSNKVKPVLQWYDTIQSLDRAELIERIDRIASELGHVAHCLVQANVSGAGTQGGVEPTELHRFLDAAATHDYLRIHGLMAIGPNTDDSGVIRRAFATLRKTAEQLAALKLPRVTMEILSIGMSGDYEIAVEEGSSMVRIGTAIFGPRGR